MKTHPEWKWQSSPGDVTPRNYVCGHPNCGREVASNKAWFYHDPHRGMTQGWIYICPNCHRPTFFDDTDNSQVPGVRFGRDIEHLPDDISRLYQEIGKSTAVEAHTTAVLGCRKLLMHIAVEKGAEQGLGFIEYVKYLVENHYAPPGSTPWVDKIREMGNEANHEIVIMKRGHAVELINFVEMLLKFIYEFPAKIGTPTQMKPKLEISREG